MEGIFKRAAKATAKEAIEALTRLHKDAPDDQSHPKETPDEAKVTAERVVALISLASFDDVPDVVEPPLAEMGQHAADETFEDLGPHLAELEPPEGAFVQLGSDTREQLTGRVDQSVMSYARSRSAEMVGKSRLADGTLVDNPNAEWVITDTTRNEIRKIIADGVENGIGKEAIAEQIEAATAFSPERAMLIARTEISQMNNMAVLWSFQES